MGTPIAIRNVDSKRVFDVNVDEEGKIINYEVKTEKGKFKVSVQEVTKQIAEKLKLKTN